MPRSRLLIAFLAALVSIGIFPALAGATTPGDLTVHPTVGVTPAPTGGTAPAEAEWIPATCATGELTTVETDAALNTTVSGAVSICGTYKPKAAFTAVLFRPDRDYAIAAATSLRSYDPAGPKPVTLALVTAPSTGTAGLCLMRSPTARIACVRLDFTLGQPAVMHAISTDDPLVAKPVIFVDDTLAPHPPAGFCGSCLAVP
ncbi:hypothetical protein GCM10022251_64150 [Phytohabitans flavus]|uniref:Uncharacterized protein n=1 Tax=Phytohabitans flavus TaxID=1076124 RepID=A0A6F8XV58_9ACTN|nr:hypothetical protein [Phytohabitans flavus]BCB77700.1 hypothetical protein Pflav_041100 [Phytohabitans flavus]